MSSGAFGMLYMLDMFFGVRVTPAREFAGCVRYHPACLLRFLASAKEHSGENVYTLLMARADITVGIADRIIHIQVKRTCIRAIIPISTCDATVCNKFVFCDADIQPFNQERH